MTNIKYIKTFLSKVLVWQGSKLSRLRNKNFISQGYTETQAKLKVPKLLGHEREDVTRIYLASIKKNYDDGWMENGALKTLYNKVSHKYFVSDKSLEDSWKMKNILCEYSLTNVFLSETEDELKQNINKKIRYLCITDIEKVYSLDYNIGVAFWGDTSKSKIKEVSEQC